LETKKPSTLPKLKKQYPLVGLEIQRKQVTFMLQRVAVAVKNQVALKNKLVPLQRNKLYLRLKENLNEQTQV